MTNRIIFLDCETKTGLTDLYNKLHPVEAPSNYKDAEKIKAYIEGKDTDKAIRVDTDYCDIFCVGLKEENKDAECFTDKKEIEKKLNEVVKNAGRIITFNGRLFDIPVLMRWGIKNNLNLPYRELRLMAKKYNNDLHIDIAEMMTPFRSLDELLQIYLQISKKEIDFKTCTDQELINHCLEDIKNTELLFNKLKPILI